MKNTLTLHNNHKKYIIVNYYSLINNMIDINKLNH